MHFIPNNITGILVNHKYPGIVPGIPRLWSYVSVHCTHSSSNDKTVCCLNNAAAKIIFATSIWSTPDRCKVFIKFHNPDITAARPVSRGGGCSDSIRNLCFPDHDIFSGRGFYNLTDVFSAVACAIVIPEQQYLFSIPIPVKLCNKSSVMACSNDGCRRSADTAIIAALLYIPWGCIISTNVSAIWCRIKPGDLFVTAAADPVCLFLKSIIIRIRVDRRVNHQHDCVPAAQSHSA